MTGTPRLRLRPGIAVLRMGNAVQLRAGDEQIHVLETDPPELALRVLAMLDGSHDRASLAREVASGDVEVVLELVAELHRHAFLLPAITPGPSDSADYLARFASEDRHPASALSTACVSVRGHEPSITLVASIVREHGIAVERDERDELRGALAPILCAVERPDLSLLYDVNDAACRSARSCLFVDLSHGTHATVGPFFVPGEGACYRCFRRRLHENTAAYAELVTAERHMLDTREPLPAQGHLPAHRHVVLGIAAAELVAFFTRHRPLRTLDRALTVDLEGLRVWSEPVLRVPWCACGSSESQA